MEEDAWFLSSLLQAKIPITLFNGRRKGMGMKARVSIPNAIHITMQPIPYIALSTLLLIWYQSARLSAN